MSGGLAFRGDLRDRARDILEWWGDLKWRHHGTGMLQAYAPGCDDLRVHVWHPSLLLPGMTESGSMHNHRFHFRSTVLVGSILHDFLSVVRSADGGYIRWSIGLASRSEDKDLAPMEQVLVVEIEASGHAGRGPETFRQGDSYEVGKWGFHHARPAEELAITVVDIRDKDHSGSASLLAPCGTVPVAAFSTTVDPDLILKILALAHTKLLEATDG